jgi:hypothetical protein
MVKNGLADDGVCIDGICSKIQIMKSMLVLHMAWSAYAYRCHIIGNTY